MSEQERNDSFKAAEVSFTVSPGRPIDVQVTAYLNAFVVVRKARLVAFHPTSSHSTFMFIWAF
jgi:hypothetical protein